MQIRHDIAFGLITKSWSSSLLCKLTYFVPIVKSPALGKDDEMHINIDIMTEMKFNWELARIVYEDECHISYMAV